MTRRRWNGPAAMIGEDSGQWPAGMPGHGARDGSSTAGTPQAFQDRRDEYRRARTADLMAPADGAGDRARATPPSSQTRRRAHTACREGAEESVSGATTR